MPAEDDIRKQLDLELFDEKEAAKLAELVGKYDCDQNLGPMVLGGTGPVRVINILELEVPEQWRERYYPRGMPQSPTVSPEARKRWTDIEPDSKLVEQVPTEEREQWREMEAAAIDRRLADMDKNWIEMAQLCGVGDEPGVVRILCDEKLLPALARWKPVIGAKHYKRLSTKWAARLNAREIELRHKQVPTVAEATTQLSETDPILARATEKLADSARYRYMDAKEAKAVLNVSIKTVYLWADEGKLERPGMGKQTGKRAKFLVTTESVKMALEVSPV